jgi:hypothetical protein
MAAGDGNEATAGQPQKKWRGKLGLSPALRFGIVTDFCGVLVQSGRPVLR